ncbi:ABC transporter permease [Liquorilactobacillus satsumensis]|uniref:ABC transporter permease n=1 Tax=Liquorilactobacillus satsumensis TaxID=259059 RepID=UPI0021C25B2A|nr:ABC transporter permease [Liquorilactobacillus satsumensis]MCP9312560.1 ABC transporter permease [Liquorilactobacillus satsumensis]MCP9360317.1 ABC transporter permease [Liquorilactobacillus satsumensis]
MRILTIMFEKELVETWRTYRFLTLITFFLILALMSPLVAKLTPTIIKLSLNDTLNLQLPQPTAFDSWKQFYKGITQLGILVTAILFAGTMSQELSKNTLVNLVTKGLPRWTIVLSKYFSLLLQWTVALSLSLFVTWGYTAYYFPAKITPTAVLAGFLPLLLFGIFLLALILFGSTLGQNNYGGLLIPLFITVILYLINLVKQFHNYNPLSLIGDNLAILQGTKPLSQLLPSMLVAIAASLFLLGGTVVLLNHRKI